jgi:hypothetical protein
LFQQGEFLSGTDGPQEQRLTGSREAAAYTFCYNDTLFAHRVHDVLTLIASVRHADPEPRRVHLLGSGGGGLIAAAARSLAGSLVDKMAIDTQGFRFADVKSIRDPNFVPGAVKYGDLPALLALNAPERLWIGGEAKIPPVVQATYDAAGAGEHVATTPDACTWLLR